VILTIFIIGIISKLRLVDRFAKCDNGWNSETVLVGGSLLPNLMKEILVVKNGARAG
jgi:hypothetical protein